MSDPAQAFDFVVVGAGTAGCVLAARLSEDAQHRVCLIEAGGSGRHLAVGIPAAVAMAQRTAAINWRFETTPQPNLNGRRIPVPRGRGLGGSALINGMVYFRGHPRDFDDWSQAGASGWSYREVLPYFTKSEHNEDFGTSAFHGRDGPINIRTIRRPNRLNFAFFDALADLGCAPRADLNGADSEGAGLRQVSIRAGTRETTARALLRPAMRRQNLTVLTHTHATRLIVEGRRVQAVDARRADGSSLVVHARHEVVLAAGAIQSPQLLLLSGIGDGAHLAAVGVELRHQLPGVGRNLHDHLASPVLMQTAHPASYGISLRAMPRNLVDVVEYVLLRSGPLADNIFESAAFLKSRSGLDRPDVQLVFQPAARPARLPFPVGHGFAISPVGLYPKSRGRLTLVSRDPFAAPHIDTNLLSAPEDAEPLIRGMRLIRRIFASAAFASYRAHETAPGPAAQSDAELLAYIRAHAYTVHHPVSTCRMGIDEAAVVDPQLRVIGLEGLRVADASIFPTTIGGNTNAAVVMIAEKAADLILGRPALAPANIDAESPTATHARTSP